MPGSQLCQALLMLLTILLCAGSALSCSRKNPVTKIFANPRVTSVDKHTCFTEESIRLDDGVPGYTNTAMANDLSVNSCKKFCRESGFEGKLIALTPTECHCNKWLKYDGERDSSKCPIRCRGNDQDFCGGIGYVSAYPS